MPSLTLLQKPEPLLPQVVAFLTENKEKNFRDGLLDLSDSVLILPTQEARRRLHEALVREAASHNASLLPPRWMLPMQLAEGQGGRVAPSSVEQILWIRVISGMTAEERQRLFPRKVPRLDPSAAGELAASITSLRGELAQVGMSLSDAATKRTGDLRWQALLSMEQRFLATMEQEGYADRISSQLAGTQHPILHQGGTRCRRVVIAGVPDLPKIYDAMISRIEEQGVSVEIVIYDPAAEGRGFFDALGRPSESWATIPIPIESSSIHLCLDHAEEAEKAARLALASGGTSLTSAIALTSPDLARPVQDALESLAIPSFNPAGDPLTSLPIGRLLKMASGSLREGDFRSVLQLLRHPAIQQWLGLHPAHDLKILDDLQNQFIPSSLDDLLARWPDTDSPSVTAPVELKKRLEQLRSLLADLASGSGTAPLLKTLKTIYSTTDLARLPGGRESVEQIRGWIFRGKSLMEAMRCEDLLNLLLSHLQSSICTGEKNPDAIELPGWLELLWEDAPHLIVTGMNDGLVPEVRKEDPFLSDSTRRSWGLPCDASRLCRDGYLLLSLIASRPGKSGRVDFLLARQDDEGGGLKPSRLLLRTDDAELPYRVRELFRELPPRAGEKWLSAWALRPEHKESPSTLSASAIRDYLACPARFYLKQVLGLRAEKFGAEEADAATFGTLLHTTLSQFGNDAKLRNLREPEQIEAALVGIWKRLLEDRYGNSPLFPLLYQREAGIRRLRGAALAQGKARSEGWEIVACERKFEGFPVAGIHLKGQIDRIDRRKTEAGIEWRILDYKSSESEKDPASEHYRTFSRRDDPDRFAGYEKLFVNEKLHHWTDLQLPIYRQVLLSEIERGHSDFLALTEIATVAVASVEAGYFILPSKIDETQFLSFDQIGEHQQSAIQCLEGVVHAIQSGIFWPPRHPKYDEFTGLFFDHLEASKESGQQTLDPEMLKGGVL
jgi:ATP-dependent helicase/nuclease subunit B